MNREDYSKIYCAGCDAEVTADLVSGAEVYPHRPDLATLPFWQCPTCKNFVGCHYKTATPTKPMGIIATKELKKLKMEIHDKLDALWMVNGKKDKRLRGRLYKLLSEELGTDYHTGNIRSTEEARKVLQALDKLTTPQPESKLSRSGSTSVDFIYVDKWEAPDKIEGPDPHIICMPNIPKPIQGPQCQPRTICGASTWDHMRRRCYYLADYKCECCGREVGKDIEKRQLAAHELFEYDFVNGVARFVRCVALCHLCHTQGGVHTGRMLTMYKKGNPFMTASMVLEGAEHAFSLVHNWNTEHPDEEPLRLYGTWIELMDDKKIGEEIQALVKKYDVKFYGPTKNQAEWSKWKLIIGNREYPTPYKDESDWQRKMDELNAKQVDKQRTYSDPFSGGVFDEIKKTLENG